MRSWQLAAAAALAIFQAGATSAATSWMEARTEHFNVYMRGDEAHVRKFASELERFDGAMRMLRSLPAKASDRANPVTVYAVDDTSDIRDLCAGPQGRKGCRFVGGFYLGRVSGSMLFVPRRAGSGMFDLGAQTVLFHEYSHHFMLANWPGLYPAWFVEGFAEFNSTAKFDKAGKVGFGLPAMHRLPNLYRSPVQLPIARVLAGSRAELTSEQVDSFYAKGWLLTHYLTFEPSRAGQLGAYLDALSKGVPGPEAAKVFGDLNRLDRDLRDYLRRPSMSYAEVSVAELPTAAIDVRTLTPGEQVMMIVKMRSDRGVNRESAPIVVTEARRIAAAYPDDPGVQLALAEAEYDVSDYTATEAAADRALAVRPSDRTALLYKGQAQEGRLRSAKSHDTAAWRGVRDWYLKANATEHDAAEPLWLFYRSFREQGIEPTGNSVNALARAFELVPQDRGLRWQLAREMVRSGKLEQGRTLLAPIAFDPHMAADNPAARLMGMIDKGDKAGIDGMLNRQTPRQKSSDDDDDDDGAKPGDEKKPA